MFRIRNLRVAGLTACTAALMTGVAVGTPLLERWSAAANLESLPGSSPNINTPAVDGCASLSADGLMIAFTSNRSGNFDIYTATRSNKALGFGNPVPLPAPINSAADEACPTLASGNRLYFSSDRDDPAYDLYATRLVGNAWTAPLHLGPNINTPGRLDESAALYPLGRHEIMLFSSRNLDGSDGKIFQSSDGGPKSLVQGGPNGFGSNTRPSITPDGKTIYFDSDRPGGLGGPDLYVANRGGAAGPFGAPVHLTSLSSPAFDARPFISGDGTILTFSSARAGSTSPAPDIWFSTRR
jgi:Tol biopolymer transport system component